MDVDHEQLSLIEITQKQHTFLKMLNQNSFSSEVFGLFDFKIH